MDKCLSVSSLFTKGGSPDTGQGPTSAGENQIRELAKIKIFPAS